MNKSILALVCLLLSFAIAVSFAACSKNSDETAQTTEVTEEVLETYTDSPGSVSKNETVYVNLDSAGAVRKINVTDWLHTDKGKVSVFDISDLSDIENLKDNILPVMKDNGFVWNMSSTDLYYGGVSKNTPPVSFNISYTLNGKAVTADEIAEKSGDVSIKIEMKNDLYTTKTLNGKKIKLYLPVIVVGGMIFDDDTYTGVEIENGVTIGDATKEIAAVFGAPGLTESLGITNKELNELMGMELSNNATITAKTDRFKLGNMYFVVIPLCSMSLDFVDFNSVDDLNANLMKIKSVLSKIKKFNFDEIMDLLTMDSNKLSDLSKLVTDATNVYEENKVLIDVMEKYMTKDNFEKLSAALEKLDASKINQVVKLLSNPLIQNFFTDLPKLVESLEDVSPLLDSLMKALNDTEVKKAINNLPNTLKQLDELQKGLEENSELIETLTEFASSENLAAIQELAAELKKSGVIDDTEKFDKIIGNVNQVIDRGRLWYDFGKSYRIFTKASDNADTSVMFVFKTDSIG